MYHKTRKYHKLLSTWFINIFKFVNNNSMFYNKIKQRNVESLEYFIWFSKCLFVVVVWLGMRVLRIQQALSISSTMAHTTLMLPASCTTWSAQSPSPHYIYSSRAASKTHTHTPLRSYCKLKPGLSNLASGGPPLVQTHLNQLFKVFRITRNRKVCWGRPELNSAGC